MSFNPGNISLYLSFFSLSCVLLLSVWGARKNNSLYFFRQFFYLIHFGSVFYAFYFLAKVMLLKDYSYAYVYDHTANEIDPWYTFASIWEGQEGSFLLWLLLQ